MIAGTKIEVTKEMGDENDYEVTFDVGLTATNKTDQTLKWYLVRTQEEVESLSDITACNLVSESDGDNHSITKYYYNGCTVENALGKISDGVLVGFGDITAGDNTKLVTKEKTSIQEDSNLTGSFTGEDQQLLNLSGHKLYTDGSSVSKDNSNMYYYYLIVEFTNNTGESQNGASDANFGKEISVTFDKITNILSKVKTS